MRAISASPSPPTGASARWPARCSAAAGRGSFRSRASIWRPELAPNMLYVTNLDRPGFIGRLGTALGEEGVNISTFNLGRSSDGEDAIALIGVDQELYRCRH